jgi:uncharacterized protein YecE (DUF72 family)
VIRIGTSGWLYPPWRGVFYPKGLPHRRELEYISRQVDSVEINGSFYSLQRPASYQRWAAETPDDFVFAVKGGRFITHMKRLKDVETPLANFFASGVLALDHKLGPVLWQFPANFAYDPDLMSRFFAMLPRSTGEAAAIAAQHDSRLDGRSWTEVAADRPIRHTVEVSHPSFADPSYVDLLRRNDIATVVADTAGKFPYFDDVTTDFVYIRLHGDVEIYASGYSDEALDMWADRIRRWDTDTYVYFDNDIKVKAPGDAIALRKRLPVTQ